MITEEIEALLARTKGTRYHSCKAALAIDRFEGADREAIARLLDSNVTSPTVVEYLATKDINIKASAINKHRRRNKGTGCLCPVTL